MSQTTYDWDDSMPPNRPVTFPLETMTDSQRQVFIRFLAARREDWMNIHEPIWLALLLAGERPATEISTFAPHPSASDASEPPITVQEVAEIFDLPFRGWTNDTVHVARTSWRFDLRPTQGVVSDAYHRRLGCFLGYPPADVEYFITKETACTQPEDLVADGVFQPEEIAFTTFVPQRHDTTIEGYERAIETGKTNRSTIAVLADAWNISALDAYADWLYHDALTDCLTNV